MDLRSFLLARTAETKAAAEGDDDAWTDYVVDQCEAVRRIVEAEPERWVLQSHAPGHTVDMGTPEGMVRVYGKLITELEYRDRYMELAPPSQTLLYLALPYAAHPDYRAEWAEAAAEAA